MVSVISKLIYKNYIKRPVWRVSLYLSYWLILRSWMTVGWCLLTIYSHLVSSLTCSMMKNMMLSLVRYAMKPKPTISLTIVMLCLIILCSKCVPTYMWFYAFLQSETPSVNDVKSSLHWSVVPPSTGSIPGPNRLSSRWLPVSWLKPTWVRLRTSLSSFLIIWLRYTLPWKWSLRNIKKLNVDLTTLLLNLS